MEIGCSIGKRLESCITIFSNLVCRCSNIYSLLHRCEDVNNEKCLIVT